MARWIKEFNHTQSCGAKLMQMKSLSLFRDQIKKNWFDFFEFMRFQKKIIWVSVGVSLALLGVIFSLLTLTKNLNVLIQLFDVKKHAYIKMQNERLNTLSMPSQEAETLFSFYKKKSFEKPFKNNQIQKTVEKIKRQLHLEVCKITTEADILKEKDLKIYSKRILIDLQTNSSEKIYKFVDRLHHLLPGLVVFNKFNISKNESLKNKKNKESQYSFKGKIDCCWLRQKQE
ncbi:MAG: hypothetical protein HEEMFOPI_00591 [Holosporales bacterium]